MSAELPILFNHIPKTGGTTLRIIFNRVYGENAVFFINSTDILSSLEAFKAYTPTERSSFKVISGHGSVLLKDSLPLAFKVCILREPVDLFLSQYYYLRKSKNSSFLDEVSQLRNVEDYLRYAIEKGQDNLLTRYLSDSVSFLINPIECVPSMNEVGDELLQAAKNNLHNYDALINLDHFEKGVYALSEVLGWSKIPFYRSANKNAKRKYTSDLSVRYIEQLRHYLRFDIQLFEYFQQQKLGMRFKTDFENKRWKRFQKRQQFINKWLR